MLPAEVGAGLMDWPAILTAANAAGVRRYYIEQEPPYVGPRIDSIAKSASYLLGIRT
jgi:sugar phosphate isomerase/epimerase